MYAKTIQFTDYDGNEREETFYFNLNKAEVIKWEGSTLGGLKNTMDKIIQTKDQSRLIALFDDIICRSYGEKSPDGKYFRKSEEILENFKSTQAYSNLFTELASNDQAASEFVNGMLPADLLEEARKIEEEEKKKGNVQALPGYKAEAPKV